MNELVQNLIAECKQKQEIEKLCKANTIEFNNYFKYSGETEPYSKEYAEFLHHVETCVNFTSYYKKRVINKNIFLLLNKEESKIIDFFYKNSDKTLIEIADSVGHSKTYTSQVISKHLKIQKNDKKNTDRLS
jgi:DNA-directed RNA polymerase specialized sigma subunit|tara:strand:- start:2465 stop:2860 length:396 start_codon:yes stop_codon:yes gene_type:complete